MKRGPIDFERPERWEGAPMVPGSVHYSRSGDHFVGALESSPFYTGAGVWRRSGNLIAFYVDHARLAWLPDDRGLLLVSTRDNQLELEVLSFPDFESLSKLSWPAPLNGIGGYLPSVGPRGRHGALLLYSGQCETGYLLLALQPLRLVLHVPYRYARNNLEPPAFSPSGKQLALILYENARWWTEAEDAEEDTPAEGGTREWAALYVHRFGDAEPKRYALCTHVGAGWFPSAELLDEPYHSDLCFVEEAALRVRLPWGRRPVNLRLDAGHQLRLPSASRSKPR